MNQYSQQISITQAINGMMIADPLGFAKIMNGGMCYQAQAVDCNFFQQLFGLCPTSAPTSEATAIPMSRPEATASLDTNPCSTGGLFPVFGSCDGCAPHGAGQGYNPPHRAIDIAPVGAFVQQYLPPDWATTSGTSQFANVYAVADGTIYGREYTRIDDELILRVNDTLEFVYVHINPRVPSGFVTKGTLIGTVISDLRATTYIPEGHASDEDHLHFGLRHPYDITQSVDPASCLGLTGG